MDSNTIKLKTMQLLNGVKYLQQSQFENLCSLVCDELKIEVSEENIQHIKDGCITYFSTINKVAIN